MCLCALLRLTVDQAEAAAPQENVYPSNLSAALYEMGDYSACLDAISRSWTLSASPALALRLATRAAKALAQGVRGGTIGPVALAKHAQAIVQLETIAMQQESSAGVDIQPESVRVWREWHAIAAEAGDRNSVAHDARVRLAAIPIARRGVWVVSPFSQIRSLTLRNTETRCSSTTRWGRTKCSPSSMTGALGILIP